MKEGSFTLKSRADTRWCANAAATKAVRLNYGIIMQTLKELNVSADEDPTTKKKQLAAYLKKCKNWKLLYVL